MAVILSIPDSVVPSLNDFKRRHRHCSGMTRGMDKIPADHFTYAYVPSTLGGVTEVRCSCGARWIFGGGEPYETLPSDVHSDSTVLQAVRILHLAMTRPRLVMGSAGDRTPSDIEMLWKGMSAALFSVSGCEAFDQIIMEWTSRLYEEVEGVLPDAYRKSNRAFRYSDAYAEAGFGWKDTLSAWDKALCSYLRESWPGISNAMDSRMRM